jgi:hypothetical protein
MNDDPCGDNPGETKIFPKRPALIKLLEKLITEHFEWCKGTPENETTASEEQDMLGALNGIDKNTAQVIYTDNPIELELPDGRRIEIGSKIAQIRQEGKVLAVYERQQPEQLIKNPHRGFLVRLFHKKPEFPGNCQVCGAGTKISVEVKNTQGIASGWYCFEHLLAALARKKWLSVPKLPTSPPITPLEMALSSVESRVPVENAVIGMYFCETCDEASTPKFYAFTRASPEDITYLCNSCAKQAILDKRFSASQLVKIIKVQPATSKPGDSTVTIGG